MKKYTYCAAAFLVLSALLLISCAPDTPEKPSVVGNQAVISEITRIEQLIDPESESNSKITVNDLQYLEEATQGDEIAEDYTKEIKWLVAHNESEHLLHVTSFMREYIGTGKDVPCVPHELWHVSLYIKHGDLDYAQEAIISLDEEYGAWVKSVEAKRKFYPQYYTTLDDLEQKSKDAIGKLKQNDFSNDTLGQLDIIGAYALC